MDERYETLLANLAAIAAGQQILIDRLLRDASGVGGVAAAVGGGSGGDAADDAELQRIAHDLRVLLAATRLFLRAGPPEADDAAGEEEDEASVAEGERPA